MNTLRAELVEVGLWPAGELADPTWDIAVAWRLVEQIAIYQPELHARFVRELTEPYPLLFSMHAPYAAVNICRAAYIAKTGQEPPSMKGST